VVAVRNGTSASRFQGIAHPVEHLGDVRVALDVVPTDVCFDQIVIEVVELPLIGKWL